MTKKELARLVRVSRGLPYFRVSATEKQFFCPMDHEWRRKNREPGISHRFTVYHLAWETGTNVAAVTKALADHLDPDMEACQHVKRAES